MVHILIALKTLTNGDPIIDLCTYKFLLDISHVAEIVICLFNTSLRWQILINSNK